MLHNKKNNTALEAAPWRPGLTSPRNWLTALALVGLPLAAHADRNSTYAHAEISIGIPNGQITLGHTWETGGRTVVVSEERECERREDTRTVIIEKRVEPPPRVIVVERREPEVVVIEREYCPPPERRVVVVREAPRRHVTVIRREREVVRHYRRHDGERHVERHDNRGGNYERHESRPRELFGTTSPRPMRERGVQHIRVDR